MNNPACDYLSESVQEDLLWRWREPHRRYHTVEHLAAVLGALDVLSHNDVEFDREPVQLAVWFHDAIYDVTGTDNEERSAALALQKLSESVVAEEVARLVRVTADHRVVTGDSNAAALCDADLSVLAGSGAEYAAYASNVRDEYSAVPADAFAAGRASLLERMLTAEALFHTPYGRENWESLARRNVAAEIESLRAQ